MEFAYQNRAQQCKWKLLFQALGKYLIILLNFYAGVYFLLISYPFGIIILIFSIKVPKFSVDFNEFSNPHFIINYFICAVLWLNFIPSVTHARSSLPMSSWPVATFFLHKHYESHGFRRSEEHLPFCRLHKQRWYLFSPHQITSPNLSIALKTRARNSLRKRNPTVKINFFARVQSEATKVVKIFFFFCVNLNVLIYLFSDRRLPAEKRRNFFWAQFCSADYYF